MRKRIRRFSLFVLWPVRSNTKHILTGQGLTVIFLWDMMKPLLFSVTKHRARCTVLFVFVSSLFRRDTLCAVPTSLKKSSRAAWSLQTIWWRFSVLKRIWHIVFHSGILMTEKSISVQRSSGMRLRELWRTFLMTLVLIIKSVSARLPSTARSLTFKLKMYSVRRIHLLLSKSTKCLQKSSVWNMLTATVKRKILILFTEHQSAATKEHLLCLLKSTQARSQHGLHLFRLSSFPLQTDIRITAVRLWRSFKWQAFAVSLMTEAKKSALRFALHSLKRFRIWFL